ncbi:PepSY domain-containing protein [Lysinibacillus sp. 54212]|uniref:PepSY domain-containing protein n=1 Tax=Lysinibacillus sp. 54212 TaxID=3119829 RepID=UPI002FC6F55C
MINKRKVILSSIVLLIFVYFLILAIGNITAETSLNQKEIVSRVESLYGGKVEAIIKKGEAYAVTFSSGKATYEVMVDAANGRFSELDLIYKKPDAAVSNEETPVNEPNNAPSQPDDKDKNTETEHPTSPAKPNQNKTEKPTTPPPSQKPVTLTEGQIITIAKKQIQGEIEDIQYYSTSDGGYYLVEIDGEEEEAVLQIHAVTGKILSVSFDD